MNFCEKCHLQWNEYGMWGILEIKRADILIYEGTDMVNSGWMGKKQVGVYHLEKMKYNRGYPILYGDKKFQVALLDSDHLIFIPED